MKILLAESGTWLDMLLGLLRAKPGDDVLIARCLEDIERHWRALPDVVLIDPSAFPGGIDLCRELCRSHRAFLIALSPDPSTEVPCLESGADDWLRKPFSARCLLARIQALLRRACSSVIVHRTIEHADVKVDLDRHMVFVDEKLIHTTKIEYALLVDLMHHAGIVRKHDALLASAWGDDYADRYPRPRALLKERISYLRRKIGDERIETVPYEGYRFVSVE